MTDICKVTKLPWVAPPDKLRPFYENEKLLYIRVVQRVTSVHGMCVRRLLIVTPKRVVLQEVEHQKVGSITRYLEPEKVTGVQHREVKGKGDGGAKTMLQVLLHVESEFDVLLNFRADKLNNPVDTCRKPEYFLIVMEKLHKAVVGAAEPFLEHSPDDDLSAQANLDKPNGWVPPKRYLHGVSRDISVGKRPRPVPSLVSESVSPRLAPSSTRNLRIIASPGPESERETFEDSMRGDDSPPFSSASSPTHAKRNSKQDRLDRVQVEWNEKIEGENVELKLKIADMKNLLQEKDKQERTLAETLRRLREDLQKERRMVELLQQESHSGADMQQENRVLQERVETLEEQLRQMRDEQHATGKRQQQLAEAVEEQQKQREAADRAKLQAEEGRRTAEKEKADADAEIASLQTQLQQHQLQQQPTRPQSPLTRRPPDTTCRPVLMSPSPAERSPHTRCSDSPQHFRPREMQLKPERRHSTSSPVSPPARPLQEPWIGKRASGRYEDPLPAAFLEGEDRDPPNLQRSAQPGSFCLSTTRSNSFASPWAPDASPPSIPTSPKTVLEHSFDKALQREGLSFEERQQLASLSIRTLEQVQYATPRDLHSVLPAPAVRKVLKASRYRAAGQDEPLVPDTTPLSLDAGLKGSGVGKQPAGGIPLALDDVGRGILTENSNLRSMAAYLQTQLTYLDALDARVGRERSSSLPPLSPPRVAGAVGGRRATASSGFASRTDSDEDERCSGDSGPVHDIHDWPPELPSYRAFLQKPDYKTLVVGKPDNPGDPLPWGASWAQRTPDAALEEAGRVCGSSTHQVIYPRNSSSSSPVHSL